MIDDEIVTVESRDEDVPVFARKTKQKSSVPPRRWWQGPEDADMLQAKQDGWHCCPDGSDGFDDAGGQDEQ